MQKFRANYISNKFILDFIIKNKPELARKPDTGFMYCNTNFALLALVVEKITATPFGGYAGDGFQTIEDE
jgi:CubicO group peptidase (beta-lactamase class C family)